jgi:hypothetical protein
MIPPCRRRQPGRERIGSRRIGLKAGFVAGPHRSCSGVEIGESITSSGLIA